MQLRLIAAVAGLILLVLFTFAWRPPQADPPVEPTTEIVEDASPQLILAPPPEDLRAPGSIRRTDRFVQPAGGSTLSPDVAVPPPAIQVPQAGSAVHTKPGPKPVRVPNNRPRPVEAGSVLGKGARVPAAPVVPEAGSVALRPGRIPALPPTVVLSTRLRFREPPESTQPTLARSIAISSDALQVAVGDTNGEIRLVDVGTKTLVRTLNLESGALLELLYTPDGALLVSGTGERLNLYDPATGDIARRYKPRADLEAMFLLPGGEHLIATTSAGRLIQFSLTSGDTRDIGATGGAAALAVSPDGRYAATSVLAGRVHIWTIDGSDRPQTIEIGGSPRCLAFSPDGRRLATAGSDARIRVWTLDPVRGPQLEKTLVAIPQPHGLQFGRDPMRLFASSQTAVAGVSQIDVRTGRVSQLTPAIPRSSLRDFALSSDGLTLAALTRDRTIDVVSFDPATSDVQNVSTITAAREP